MGFDGSSTKQAEGRSSDCVLDNNKRARQRRAGGAVRGYRCPTASPCTHEQARWTTRAPGLASSRNISYQERPPAGLPGRRLALQGAAGPYFKGGRRLQERRQRRAQDPRSISTCTTASINHEGINAEVAKGQWEFQIFGKGSKKAADEMWMARYLLERLTEMLDRRRVSPQAAR
ncbi:MAG: hypothetical protein U1E17_04740 [Geminicoccaceae bacterium]